MKLPKKLRNIGLGLSTLATTLGGVQGEDFRIEENNSTVLTNASGYAGEREETEKKTQTEIPSIELKYHSLFEKEGSNSQLFGTLHFNDETGRKLILSNETFVNGDHDAGLDYTSDKLRLNLGVGERGENDDPWRTLAEARFSKGFLGGKIQHLAEEEHYSVYGGIDLTDKVELQASGGNNGGSAVGFYKQGERTLGLGGGISENGAYDANISYSDENFLAWLQYGEDKKLDARLFFGDVNPEQAIYTMGISGSGWNERDNFYNDRTFRFGIGKSGRTSIDYFGASGNWMGKEKGSVGANIRLQEGNRFVAEIGHRPWEYATVLIANRNELDTEDGFEIDTVGLMGQTNFDFLGALGGKKGLFTLDLTGYVNHKGESEGAIGISGGLSF